MSFNEQGFSTKAIHVGQEPTKWTHRELIPPIILSTTFAQTFPGKPLFYEYSRSGNPTRQCLEESLSKLENGKHAFVFSSGLAGATTLAFLLKSGDHIICGDDVYGGTNRIFRTCFSKMNLSLTFTDCRDVESIKKCVKKNTKMVWIETPTNPTMKIADIKEIAKFVKTLDDVIFVVDNTFMSPYFQRPLKLGADISFHSVSKYINGHSDVIMGAVITNRDDIAKHIKYYQNALGTIPSPFDCFLVNRGLKTLSLRMEKHKENGLAIAKFLEKHKLINKVLHPGLESHPQYELAVKQCSGFCGMISIEIKGGLQASIKFVQSLKIFVLAESLGCVESLVEIPSLMTHVSVPNDQRVLLGINDSLIRISCGIEDVNDLINDLKQALDVVEQEINAN